MKRNNYLQSSKELGLFELKSYENSYLLEGVRSNLCLGHNWSSKHHNYIGRSYSPYEANGIMFNSEEVIHSISEWFTPEAGLKFRLRISQQKSNFF